MSKCPKSQQNLFSETVNPEIGTCCTVGHYQSYSEQLKIKVSSAQVNPNCKNLLISVLLQSMYSLANIGAIEKHQSIL